MENLEDYFTKEKVDKYCMTVFYIGVIGILYAIIAGIWGYAPAENINWKIFGTSILIAAIALIIGYVNDMEDK